LFFISQQCTIELKNEFFMDSININTSFTSTDLYKETIVVNPEESETPIEAMPDDCFRIVKSFRTRIPVNFTTPASYLDGEIAYDLYLPMLESAHLLLEKFYCILTFSKASKKLYDLFEEKRARLIKEIVQNVSDCESSENGKNNLHRCINEGAYLKVLQIFFYHKPKLLSNYGDMYRGIDYLHVACTPKSGIVSFSFVAFLLEMDKKHNLNLLNQKSIYGYIPLVRVVQFRDYDISQDKIKGLNISKIELLDISYKVETMLSEHAADLLKEKNKNPKLPAEIVPSREPSTQTSTPLSGSRQRDPQQQSEPLQSSVPLHKRALYAVLNLLSFIVKTSFDFFSYLWSCLTSRN
jgi:hypothetical protein